MTDPKYMKPGLEFAVGKLIEECGELQAALGKTIRWGWQSYNPELPEELVSSLRALANSIEAALKPDTGEKPEGRG